MSQISDNFKKFIDNTASYGLNVSCAMGDNPNAKIALVGEYPGEQEVAFNKPFVGGAGRKLWDFLRKQGISRPETYTTYIVKRRVNQQQLPAQNEFDLWQAGLEYELSLLPNLELIVCLGDMPMRALLGFTGMTQYRGSVYDWQDKKVLCVNSPGLVLRKPETEIILAMDLQKVKPVLSGDYKEHYIKKIINPDYNVVMDYIDEIQNVTKECGVDIESTGMETACVGLAKSGHDAICINFRTYDDNRWTVQEEFNILKRLARLFDDPSVTIYAQNGNFDSYFMGCKDHLTFKIDYDTLLMHHTLYPRLPHNLGFLTSQYTNLPYYKEDLAIYKEGGDIDSFWEYNCTDAAITFYIAKKMIEELRAQNMLQFFETHVAKLQPHLSMSTTTGVAVDLEIKNSLTTLLEEDLAVLQDQFDKAVQLATNDKDRYVNPNSPKQLTKLLFDDLKCKATKRSADAQTRDNIVTDPRTNIETKNVITALDRYATERKFFSTYVNTELDPDNRFRAEFKQYGVSKAPGRLSSSQTLWKTGGNAQNQPRRAYEMYIPDDGCVFIYFDLAQAEARYVAWDAHIEQWIEDFERARIDGKFDAHRSLAATMFNMPYDQVPEKDEIDGVFTKRYIAKRCRHGLNYRMHIARLAITTGLTYMQAAQNYYLYHRTNPELQVWWDLLIAEVRKTKMQFNCFGRRNLFLEPLNNDGAMDSVVAFKPQSSIGDKTQRVWYQCHEDSRWDHRQARIALNVHDALYGIATPRFAKTALSIMKSYAEEPLLIKSTKTGLVTPMIIPADCKISVPSEKTGKHSMASMQKVDIDTVELYA